MKKDEIERGDTFTLLLGITFPRLERNFNLRCVSRCGFDLIFVKCNRLREFIYCKLLDFYICIYFLMRVVGYIRIYNEFIILFLYRKLKRVYNYCNIENENGERTIGLQLTLEQREVGVKFM